MFPINQKLDTMKQKETVVVHIIKTLVQFILDISKGSGKRTEQRNGAEIEAGIMTFIADETQGRTVAKSSKDHY